LEIEEREVVRSTDTEREREMHTHTHTHTQWLSAQCEGLAKRPLQHNTWKNVQYKIHLLEEKETKACCDAVVSYTLKSLKPAKRSHSSQSWLIWWKTPTDFECLGFRSQLSRVRGQGDGWVGVFT